MFSRQSCRLLASRNLSDRFGRPASANVELLLRALAVRQERVPIDDHVAHSPVGFKGKKNVRLVAEGNGTEHATIVVGRAHDQQSAARQEGDRGHYGMER
jgi:hypothetical protein